MTLYWISWYQSGPDPRPLNYLPNESVLGYWNTGSAGNDCFTICALVKAKDDDEAFYNIQIDWPEITPDHIRFCYITDNTRLGDRFPIQPWMQERIKLFENKGG